MGLLLYIAKTMECCAQLSLNFPKELKGEDEIKYGLKTKLSLQEDF